MEHFSSLADNLGEILKPLQLIANQATRWNSAHNMIERAIQVKTQIELFCFSNSQPKEKRRKDETDNSLDEDTLDYDDWLVLADLLEILRPPKALTIHMESCGLHGERGTFFGVMPAVMHLQELMEGKCNHYAALDIDLETSTAHTKHMATCTNNALEKLQKYYTLCDDSTAYTAALVTNPFQVEIPGNCLEG